MAIFIYIGKLMSISALLYGYYYLFLRNKRFHHYNRFYLLLVVLLSFIIPFLHIDLLLGGHASTGFIKTLRVINASGWEEPVTIYAHQNSWTAWLTLQNGLSIVYTAGLLSGLFLLVRSLVYIRRLKRRYCYETVEQLKIYNTAEPGTPFSFFRSIFWDNKISFNSQRGQQIFRHELFHVREKHSADILLLEILCSIAWYNPFFHLIKKELKAIHEFLADDYAVSGNNRYDYAELLLMHAIQQKTPAITHPFFHNQIKRRITMITKSNLVRRSGYISRIMALPLLFLLVSAFAVKLTSEKQAKTTTAYASKMLTVVIDPGHGGIFHGGQNENGTLEKNITLSIAQKIKALAASYNVNIVLTRDNDAVVGNASNLQEDLQNRVTLAANAKADLFVSIHANATEEKTTSRSGFDAYISGRNAHTGDRELASVLLTSLKDIYAVNETIQQRQTGIVVLDKTDCPAVCLECGYITNTEDLAFISNPVNQEKVARKILEGLVKYRLPRPDVKETTQTGSGFTSDTAVLTGQAAKEQLMAAAKKQLEKSVRENQDNKSLPTIENENLKDPAIKVFSIGDTIPADKNIIFTKVENEAEYPGGQQGWRDYLLKTLHYPQVAIDKKIMGTVIVQFIVDENGKVSNVKTTSGPKELQAESIRVIKESGNWISATQNGKKVRAYKKQPITYKLS